MDIFIWVCLKMLCTPLYPMVLLIIIPIKNGYFIGNIPYFQTNPNEGKGGVIWEFISCSKLVTGRLRHSFVASFVQAVLGS